MLASLASILNQYEIKTYQINGIPVHVTIILRGMDLIQHQVEQH